MNPMIFRQSDPRWGSLPYPTASSPVSTDGCGLLAVTHCAIERSKYWNSTPKAFYSFMKKYAVAGNGTLWDGIDAGLNQFIGNSKRFDSMSAFWNEVAKGNRVGVILFHSGSAPDGTVWTSSGHYVAFTGYKVSNGKHYLYLCSGSGQIRRNTATFINAELREHIVKVLNCGLDEKTSEFVLAKYSAYFALAFSSIL